MELFSPLFTLGVLIGRVRVMAARIEANESIMNQMLHGRARGDFVKMNIN